MAIMVALARETFIGVAEVKSDETNLRDNKKESRYMQLFQKFAVKGRI